MAVLALVRVIVESSTTLDDGVKFLPATAKAEVIREEGAYSDVRVSIGARLASANLPFHVDVNVGDPIWPAPGTITPESQASTDQEVRSPYRQCLRESVASEAPNERALGSSVA